MSRHGVHSLRRHARVGVVQPQVVCLHAEGFPASSFANRVIVTQRALSVTQRALSVAQRALSVTQRALSVNRVVVVRTASVP
jgi:hypothetical protein